MREPQCTRCHVCAHVARRAASAPPNVCLVLRTRSASHTSILTERAPTPPNSAPVGTEAHRGFAATGCYLSSRRSDRMRCTLSSTFKESSPVSCSARSGPERSSVVQTRAARPKPLLRTTLRNSLGQSCQVPGSVSIPSISVRGTCLCCGACTSQRSHP